MVPGTACRSPHGYSVAHLLQDIAHELAAPEPHEAAAQAPRDGARRARRRLQSICRPLLLCGCTAFVRGVGHARQQGQHDAWAQIRVVHVHVCKIGARARPQIRHATMALYAVHVELDAVQGSSLLTRLGALRLRSYGRSRRDFHASAHL